MLIGTAISAPAGAALLFTIHASSVEKTRRGWPLDRTPRTVDAAGAC